MTEFASAIADLRLSGEKLNQDANAIRSQLLRITQRLEQDAAVKLTATIDVRQAQRDLQAAISRFSSVGGFSIPVSLDTDAALDELAAFESLTTDPVIVPVAVDVDGALSELAALESLSNIEPAVIPVTVNDDEAIAALDRIENQALPQVQQSFANAGDTAGQQFAQSLERTIFSAVGTLSIGLGAFLTTSLVRGFQRFTTIEDATAALTVALESSAEAAIVLDDVLGVVTGTPFNLDQFANAASNLISFGVEAEKVPGYLEAIAEASASRGGRANEFAQRLATTFGQIQVQGRVLGEDLLSLQATGVDALRILGNSFGETTIDIREMLSSGVIPAEKALDVLAKGILEGTDGINGATVAFAGTAERLRETLTGARGGFESATARFGAAIIRPLEDALTQGFNSATDIVNQFTKQADALFGGLAATDGFEAFVETLADLPDLIDPVIEALAEFGPALAPLAAGFGALGVNQLVQFLAPLGIAIPGINALALAITALVAVTPELRNEVLPILADLGEALATLGAGLGAALGDAIEAVTPLLGEFAEALGDLTPFVTDIATFTVALAQGFVPVLEALVNVLEIFPVEVLIAIGGGLVAFKGLNAATGPVDSLTRRISNFGAELQLADADSERFGNRWTGVAQRFGVTGQQVDNVARKVSTSLDVAASAAAGFASGFALAAEDATTQALGLAGATTSIATAFATGGVPGGLVATAATVGGALVKLWTDSKQAAEEYEQTINTVAEQVIEDLGAATAALLDAQGLLEQGNVEEQALEFIDQEQIDRLEAAGVSVAEILAAGAESGIGDTILADLSSAYDQALQETQVFLAEQERLTGQRPSSEEASQFFAEQLAAGLQSTIDQLGPVVDLSGLLNLDVEGGIDSQGVFTLFNDPLQTLRTTGEDLQDINGLLVDTGNTIDDINQKELILIDKEVLDFADEFKLSTQQVLAFRDEINQAGVDSEGLDKAIRDAGDNVQAYLNGSAELAAVGVTPWDLILGGVAGVKEEFDVLVEVNEDGTLKIVANAEATEAAINGITDAAAALATALEAADAVAQRFTDTLQEQLSVLDDIARNQDFVAGFEEIGATLGEIINQEELDDAQSLIDKISDGRESIADLQAQLAQEKADSAIEIQDLDRRIRDAEALGSVTVLAGLKRERDRVLEDLAESEREVREQIDDVSNLESELNALSQTPITLDQLLRSQAADAGLSFAEFLISPNVSPEGREFFQGAISSQLQQFGGIIQAEVDENPLLASITIPDLTEQFIAELTRTAGLDPETARALVESVFDPEQLATEARNGFDEAFGAGLATLDSVTASILAGEKIDPSIDIDAVVEDVGGGIAALEELERRGIELPTGVDLVAAQDTLSRFTDAYEESDFTLLIPIEGDLSMIEQQLISLEDYSIQLQVQRSENQPVPDGLGPTFGNSAAGAQEPPWWERDFSTRRPPSLGSGGGGGIRYMADGGILQFKDGGITENHIAQIARGQTPFRVWSEPETGGEAYIPLGNSKRSRSTQILASVADMFGMDVVARSKGAASAAKTALDEDAMSRAVERGVTRARGVPSAASRGRAHDRAARSVNVENITVSGVRDPNKAVRKMISRLSDVALGMYDWDEDDF